MKCILIIIYCSILSAFLVNATKPKFCVDCKFFRNSFFWGTSFGKCSLFPINKDNEYNTKYLVNGIKPVKNMDYSYCSTSRKYDDMCGKDGKFYEKKMEK